MAGRGAPEPGGPWIEDLGREECDRLLRTAQVGRIAVARVDRPPMVVPVNYAYEGEVIVVRTGAGTKLDAMRTGPVTFQVDELDLLRRRGWSVMVEGEVRVATRHAPAASRPEPWVPGGKPYFARIVPTLVTGRRICLPDAPLDGRAYL